MTKTLSTTDILYTYGNYVVVINDDNTGYNVVNMKTDVVDIKDVEVLVQARSFAADIDRQEKAMDEAEQPVVEEQPSNIKLLN